MKRKFIQIAAFNYPHEMYILKSKLESEGIECNELDVNTVTANPLLSNAIGGVKLMVKEEDVEIAIKIMNSFYSKPPNSESDTILTEIADKNAIKRNENIISAKWLIFIAVIIIAIGIISAFVLI